MGVLDNKGLCESFDYIYSVCETTHFQMEDKGREINIENYLDSKMKACTHIKSIDID